MLQTGGRGRSWLKRNNTDRSESSSGKRLFSQKKSIGQIVLRLKKQGIVHEGARELNPTLNPDTVHITSNEPLIEEMLSWDLIQSRWQDKLTENEIQVIQILFNHGSMNQQTLAVEIAVSKMKMSRIITRLEAKGLLSRERLGMSNIIKLNKERL